MRFVFLGPGHKKIPGPKTIRSGDAVFILRVGGGLPLSTGGRSICKVREGLPASGSSYLPRLPIPLKRDSDTFAAFIPGYGGGSATDSHRLPCYGLFGLS